MPSPGARVVKQGSKMWSRRAGGRPFALTGGPGSDLDPPGAGIQGVLDQIDEHLLQALGVGTHAQTIGNLGDHAVRFRQELAQRQQGLVQGLAQLARRALPVRLATVVQQGADDAPGALSLVVDLGQPFGQGVPRSHGLREQMEREAQARIDAVVAAAKAEGVACDTQLLYGEEPHHEIVNTAAELAPDLIVLGRRGKRGLARLMVGHATAHVAGHAPCDVLMVPRAGRVWNLRILLATDGSAHSTAAAQVARSIAAQCQMPVTVVSATTRSHSTERKAEAQAAVDRVSTELKAAGIASEGLVAEGRPDEVVIDAAINHQADLIVVGSHGRTGLSRLTLGSLSERIMGQAPVSGADRPLGRMTTGPSPLPRPAGGEGHETSCTCCAPLWKAPAIPRRSNAARHRTSPGTAG